MQTRLRNITQRTEVKHSHASVEEFVSAPVSDGLHTIWFDDFPLDFLYREKYSKTTVIAFHAAATEVSRLPIISATGITEDIDANLVSISDPSLYIDPSVKLGWFAGNRFQKLQVELPKVIRHIRNSTNAKNLIFFGPSGGGFAALYYSSFFPESLAIGVNPRTILANSFRVSIDSYAKACWGASTEAEVDELLASTIHSDLRVHTPLPATNTVAYVQNVQDRRYIKDSLLPYLNGLEDTSHVHLLMKDWGKGHVPADRKFLAGLLKLVAARAPHWDSALEELSFSPSPDAALVANIQKELGTRSAQREIVAKNSLPEGVQPSFSRIWPLDSLRALRVNHPLTCSPSAGGQQITWTPPGSQRLYITTFRGGFNVPPAGPASILANCEGDSLIEVKFDTMRATPDSMGLTLFVLQYSGSDRRQTDTRKFRVGLEQMTHSAIVPILSGAKSFRLVFLVHSKDAGAMTFSGLQVDHYRQNPNDFEK